MASPKPAGSATAREAAREILFGALRADEEHPISEEWWDRIYTYCNLGDFKQVTYGLRKVDGHDHIAALVGDFEVAQFCFKNSNVLYSVVEWVLPDRSGKRSLEVIIEGGKLAIMSFTKGTTIASQMQ